MSASSSYASASPRPVLRERLFLVGLALVTSATLSLEVLQTRLLSVITWYSLAFLVIAMGLFGLTAGALHVYLRPNDFDFDHLGRELSRRTRQMTLAIPLSLVLLLCVPLTTAPVATTFLLFVLFGASLALPYYPAGIVVAAALTRTALPVGRVYAVDLIGAALGAPMMPWLLHYVDAETAFMVIAIVTGVGAYAFAAAASDGRGRRASLLTTAVVLVLAIVNSAGPYGLQPLWVKGRADYHEYAAELWNSHSRIRISHKIKGPALLWGGGARCTPPEVSYRVMEIDAGAGTVMLDAPNGMSGLDYLSCDVTDIANLIRPGGPAAIIGVGGGRDLQAALAAGHNPVFGIDINSRVLELLKGPFGQSTGLPQHPSVRLVHEDGRSFFSRTGAKFRLIQASLIDTWAATGAGAHALGENGLYTVEAWRTFLNHLEPGGVFTVSRWTQETLRVASLAIASLLDRGVRHPSAHLALVSTPLIVTALVAPEPLTAADVAKLQQISDDKGFSVVVAPGLPLVDGPLKNVVQAQTLVELDRATLSQVADNRPPTDDRPYFFNVLPIEAAWRKLEPIVNMGSIEGNQVATRTLALAFVSSFLLVVLTIIAPLLRRARPSGRNSLGLYAGIVYFLLIGVGFMLGEVVLLQRLSLILGDPSYSLIVVMSSLVAAMGLGSLISDRLPLHRAPLCYVYPLFIAFVVGGCSLIWPRLSAYAISAETPVRIVISVAITTCLGIPMGVAFPAGMRFAQPLHREETPWFWGMNGVGSVLASSLAVIVSQRWGLTVAMLLAAAAYILLLVPVALWTRENRSVEPTRIS